MRVAVLSSTQFGHACLKNGIAALDEVTVVGIITTPPEIEISYSKEPVRISTHADFSDLGTSLKVPIEVLSGKVRASSYLAVLEAWKPDILVALGWYYMIPRSVREAVPKGCLGIHGSLLPAYRGGAPLPWAIIRGETRTGVTLFYLEKGVDVGDIVGQLAFPIEEKDTIRDVLRKTETSSIALLQRCLPELAQDRAPRLTQDTTGHPVMPQRSPADGRIAWDQSGKQLYDFVRAQTRPYPGAFTRLDEQVLHVWALKRTGKPPGDAPPGSIVRVDQAPPNAGLWVASQDEIVVIDDFSVGENGSHDGAQAARVLGTDVLGKRLG